MQNRYKKQCYFTIFILFAIHNQQIWTIL